MLNDGSLAFNRSDSLTFAGAITGSGSVNQIGSGTTTLTGDSRTFAGTTRVEAGTLVVDGTLGGTLAVLAGGRLQGTGTVGTTAVFGTIASSALGTLHVAGDIVFNPTSRYEVEVNASGQKGRISATGVATLNGGTVQVLAGAGDYAPATTYTIVTADGGRNGTFAGVTSNLAFLDPTLSYDPTSVYLTLTRNMTSFSNVGDTRNQIATGNGIESLGMGNPIYNAVLNLSAAQARNAFDSLSGEIHGSAKSVLIDSSHFIRDAANDRIRAALGGVAVSHAPVMAYAGCGPMSCQPAPAPATTEHFAVWGLGFGAWGHIDSDGNAARLDSSTGGFLAGADAQVFETWRVGLLAGYSRTQFEVKDRSSSGASDNYHLGLFGGTRWGALGLRTGLAYTWHELSTSRSVFLPGFSDSLKSTYNAGTFQAFGELGYRIDTSAMALEPFANLAYVSLTTHGFTEQGGTAALSANGQTTATLFSTLGLRASTSLMLGSVNAQAYGTLGWRHAFGDAVALSTQAFAGSSPFTIAGAPIARNSAVIETGIDLKIGAATTFGLSYQGQLATGTAEHGFKANLTTRF